MLHAEFGEIFFTIFWLADVTMKGMLAGLTGYLPVQAAACHHKLATYIQLGLCGCIVICSWILFAVGGPW